MIGRNAFLTKRRLLLAIGAITFVFVLSLIWSSSWAFLALFGRGIPEVISAAQSSLNPQGTVSLQPNVAGTTDPERSFSILSQCPFDKKAFSVTPAMVMESIEGMGTDRQQLFDIPSETTPVPFAMALANRYNISERFSVQNVTELIDQFLPSRRIPRVIFQVGSKDQVPLGMRQAIQGIIDRHPHYTYKYFSDYSSAKWMESNVRDEAALLTYKKLAHEDLRALFFAWAYLRQEGGIYLARHVSFPPLPEEEETQEAEARVDLNAPVPSSRLERYAKKVVRDEHRVHLEASEGERILLELLRLGGGANFENLDFRDASFVAAVNKRGRISADFVASAPNFEVISDMIDNFIVPRVLENVRRRHVNDIVGFTLLSDLLRDYTGYAEKKKWFSPGTYLSPTKSLGGVLLHGLFRRSQCHSAIIYDALSFRDFASVPPTQLAGPDHTIVDHKPHQKTTREGLHYSRRKTKSGDVVLLPPPLLFMTYPTYPLERLWYRLEFDEADVMWMKRQIFRDQIPEDLGCNLSSAIFISIRQYTHHWNWAPRERRYVLPMVSFHPARGSNLLMNHDFHADQGAIAAQKAGLGLPDGFGMTQRYYHKIPMIIMQTNKGGQVPPDIRRVMQMVIVMNHDFDHYYYSDDRIRTFIATHFGSESRELKAFDDVVPGAYKSDLFRYCFLYIKGGIYMDVDFLPTAPFRYLLSNHPDVEFMSAEDCGSGGIHNGFMAAAPRHPFVKAALDEAVERISDRVYGESELEITGPTMLRQLFQRMYNETARKQRCYANGTVKMIDFHCSRCGAVVRDESNVTYLRGPFPTYISEMRWYGDKNFLYYDRWKLRTVYKDNNDLESKREKAALQSKIEKLRRQIGREADTESPLSDSKPHQES